MAINKNHEFEELDGIKCSIVEKNVKPGRVEFLKKLLEYNKFTVVVAPSPPPKAAPAPVMKPLEGVMGGAMAEELQIKREIVLEADAATLERMRKEGHARGFTVFCDEGERIGGDNTAPPPLAYFGLSVGF